MSSEIQRRLFDGSEHPLSTVLPGDRRVVLLQRAEGWAQKLVLVCCDDNDECTDVFMGDRPADWTYEGTKAQNKELDALSTVDNLEARIRDGNHHALDTKELGVSQIPSLIIMRHHVLLGSN
jgi:hypothetical protein